MGCGIAHESIESFVEELVALPSSRLDELLRTTELERRDAEVRLAAIAAVVEQRQLFLTDGHRSMATYLKAHLNCSGAEANRIRRRGKLVDERPAAAEALHAGRISMTNVDMLAKAHAHPRVGAQVAEFIPTLVEHAEHFPPKDFGVLVDRVVANADSDGADPNDDHDATATVVAGDDGVYITVTGGTALQAAEMKAVFDLAVEAEFARDVAARRHEFGAAAAQHPLPRSARRRRFAAQYAIHMAYVTAPVDGRRPEPIVNIVYTAGRAARTLADHGLADDAEVLDAAEQGLVAESVDDLLAARCETSTGVPIDQHDAARSMIRGHVRRMVIDAAGVTIDLGPRRRLFTGAAREAAQLIALTCTHPGCSIPAEVCDVDHLRPHRDGGPTDQRNGAPACGAHNRSKETARLRSRRAADGRIHLIRPDDSVILPVGERPPEWADPDPPVPSPTDPCQTHPCATDPGATDHDPPDPVGSRQDDRSDGVVPPLFETVSWDDFVAGRGRTESVGSWPIARIELADLRRHRVVADSVGGPHS